MRVGGEAKSLPPTLVASPPPDPACPIKGNVNAKGERIYQSRVTKTTTALSWQNCYDHGMCAHGKRWFCSDAEAEAAGWRPPKR